MFSQRLSYRLLPVMVKRIPKLKTPSRRCSGIQRNKNVTELFFDETVQTLLKKLTRPDMNRVFRPRQLGERLEAPTYQFMTTTDLETMRKEAVTKMEKKLQMPPVMEPREEIVNVLVEDPNLEGYADVKFIFTDISEGLNDRDRVIAVRDTDGTLRMASWEERERSNEIYFPRPGRKLKAPVMYEKEHLEKLMNQDEYEFILDSACCQFEPDDPKYISICQAVYNHIDEESNYNCLRSTRHYGPFVFYLAKENKIDNLLLENLVTDNIEEAVSLITLYNIACDSSKSKSINFDPAKPLDYIKGYIDAEGKVGSKLDMTLTTYKDILSTEGITTSQ